MEGSPASVRVRARAGSFESNGGTSLLDRLRCEGAAAAAAEYGVFCTALNGCIAQHQHS